MQANPPASFACRLSLIAIEGDDSALLVTYKQRLKCLPNEMGWICLPKLAPETRFARFKIQSALPDQMSSRSATLSKASTP